MVTFIILFCFVFSNECNDIDLWVGAHSETHVPGSVVGPLLQCILGRQFHRLKYGDRFWYQNPDAGFSQGTVVPTKSDSDEILCLQLLSKTLTCTLQLS